MSEQVCTYNGNREEDLVAFLYNDLPPDERRAFEAHAAACFVCHSELEALGSIRTQLQEWTPPDAFGSAIAREPVSLPQRAGFWAAAREMPAWAQVAAAALFMGMAAGIANLDVDVSRDGLSVRTGWSAPAQAPQAETLNANVVSRSELVAIQTSLQRQINDVASLNQQALRTAAAARTQELIRRMEGLVSESEKQQKEYLASRIVAFDSEMKAQRQREMLAIDSVLGKYNAEIKGNRNDINAIAVRLVSQR